MQISQWHHRLQKVKWPKFSEFVFVQKTSALYKAVRIFRKLHILPIQCPILLKSEKETLQASRMFEDWGWWCRIFKWKFINLEGTFHLIEIYYDRSMINLTLYSHLVLFHIFRVQKTCPQFCQNPLRD